MSKEAVLIHGWDPEKYNARLSKPISDEVAWEHRRQFIDELGEHFKLHYFNLPGFCGIKDPDVPFFELDDFSRLLDDWINLNNIKPHVIIGYSFGGAITLNYKLGSKCDTPIVLISPAIKRSETAKSRLAHKIKKIIPDNIEPYLKGVYQIVASRYYREGSPFLRATYDKIVRLDISDFLEKVDKNDILMIYGTDDQATPWELVKDKVLKTGITYCLIEGGDHNIGQSHPIEIVNEIVDFIK